MLRAYVPSLIIGAILTGGLTYYVKIIAEKFHWFDLPSPRKVHTKPVPRLGGVAIVLALILLAVGYSFASNRLSFAPFSVLHIDKRLLGVLVGLMILLIVGVIDDIRGVKPWKKLIWHFIAALSVVAFGLSISFLRLPFGLHLNLANIQFPLSLLGFHYTLVLWGDLLTVIWIVLLINTFNFLDGLDGLADGIAIITALVIFFLSVLLGQDGNALMAMIIAGVCLGFLPWNFNPAKIFLGDSGSMSLGFLIGALSIISGGKLATAFLVLGIPLLDVGWVVLRRLFTGSSPFLADKKHFHHRLLTAGLSQRQAVLLLYLVSIVFGTIGVIFNTQEKITAVIVLLLVMAAFGALLVVVEWRKRKNGKEVL